MVSSKFLKTLFLYKNAGKVTTQKQRRVLKKERVCPQLTANRPAGQCRKGRKQEDGTQQGGMSL